MKQSPWWWDSVPRTPRPADNSVGATLALPTDIDVLVVGAGFTGLTTAMTLARAGRSVAVLEKEAAGYGASTRNGGMIGSGHRVAFTEVARQYGEDVAEAVLGEGKLALSYTTDLIEEENIEEISIVVSTASSATVLSGIDVSNVTISSWEFTVTLNVVETLFSEFSVSVAVKVIIAVPC